MATTIKGLPELKARLDAVAGGGREILDKWRTTTRDKARSTAPARTGRGRASIRVGALSDTKATVEGAYWLVFIDRGTKAHDIRARKGKALRFEVQGHTVFARKVHRRRMARRPFISAAAHEAFRQHVMSDTVIGLWNRGAQSKRYRKVAL